MDEKCANYILRSLTDFKSKDFTHFMAQNYKIEISYYFSFILYAMVSNICLFYHSNCHSIRIYTLLPEHKHMWIKLLFITLLLIKFGIDYKILNQAKKNMVERSPNCLQWEALIIFPVLYIQNGITFWLCRPRTLLAAELRNTRPLLSPKGKIWQSALELFLKKHTKFKPIPIRLVPRRRWRKQEHNVQGRHILFLSINVRQESALLFLLWLFLFPSPFTWSSQSVKAHATSG